MARKYAQLFFHALYQLRAPEDINFSGQNFAEWLNEVLRLAKEQDRYEVACQHIGKILFYAPADHDGLWIDKGAAAILDKYEEMRRGFYMEAINSRGVYWDSGGKEEAFSRAYSKKASTLRDEVFFTFADCVDDIANDYAQQAHEGIERHLGDF